MTLTSGYLEPVPDLISPYTSGWGIASIHLSSGFGTAGTYESANRGIWYPLYIPTTCVARRMWWTNGSTATGNVEAGLYRDGGFKPGVKLVTTGSVGQAGTSAVQFADITDTTLAPGLHWLYLSCSSTSSTFLRTSSLTHYDELYRWDQASIGPGSAPDPAVPTESDSDQTYFVGFSTTTIT
jgi:hypothetical protein